MRGFPLAGNPDGIKVLRAFAAGRNIRIKSRGNAAVKERRQTDNADSRVHSLRRLSRRVRRRLNGIIARCHRRGAFPRFRARHQRCIAAYLRLSCLTRRASFATDLANLSSLVLIQSVDPPANTTNIETCPFASCLPSPLNRGFVSLACRVAAISRCRERCRSCASMRRFRCFLAKFRIRWTNSKSYPADCRRVLAPRAGDICARVEHAGGRDSEPPGALLSPHPRSLPWRPREANLPSRFNRPPAAR